MLPKIQASRDRENSHGDGGHSLGSRVRGTVIGVDGDTWWLSLWGAWVAYRLVESLVLYA